MDAASGGPAVTSCRGKASDHGEARARGRIEATMTDDELRRQVSAELSWDPQVDSEAIEVSVDGGTVTLRGTVGSLRQKRAGATPPHASAG